MAEFGRTFIQGGPEIPFELLDQHQQRKLIFFCGAGISRPLGLPLFDGLTEEMLKQSLGLSKVVDASNPKKLADVDQLKIYQDDFYQGKYEFVLDLLERLVVSQNNFNDSLQAIFREASYDADKMKTHRAILRLSRFNDRGDKRLVTTNFDHSFKNIKAEQTRLYDAPALPVANEDWSGIVHLHGLINDHDMNRNDIVLTSADFGRAYLKEGWARRFLLKLLKNFTILFIGYSVNDLILQYILQANAADQSKHSGNNHYILLPKPQQENDKWSLLGITPIYYKNQDGDHQQLHQTLQLWADYVGQDKNNRLRSIITNHNNREYLNHFSESDDPYIRHDRQDFVWLIRYERDVIDYFMALKGHDKPIFAWIKVLEKLIDNNAFLLSSNKTVNEYYPPEKDPLIDKLRHWLINYNYHNPELLSYILQQGQYFHPWLSEQMCRILRDHPNKMQPILTKAWRLLLDNQAKVLYTNQHLWGLLQQSQQSNCDWDDIAASLISYLKPCIQFRARCPLPDPVSQLSDLFEVTIEIPSLQHPSYFTDLYQKIIKAKPEKFFGLISPLTEVLVNILRQWQQLEQPDMVNNPPLASVAQDEQNKFHYNQNSWLMIIPVIISLFDHQCQHNPQDADANLQYWQIIFQQTGYITLKRMIYHGYRQLLSSGGTEIQVSTVIDELLQDRPSGLFHPPLRRETYQLLKTVAKKCRKTDHDKLNRLCEVILTRDDDETQRLQMFSVIDNNKSKVVDLSKFYPLVDKLNKEFESKMGQPFKLEEKNEYYCCPISCERGNWVAAQADIKGVAWQSLSAEEIYSLLEHDRDGFKAQAKRENLASYLRTFQDSDKGYELIKQYLEEDCHHHEGLDGIITAIAGVDHQPRLDQIELLSKIIDKTTTDRVVRSTIDWLRQCCQSITKDSEEEELYWPLWDKLLPLVMKADDRAVIVETKPGRCVSQAINHRAGKLVISLVEHRLLKNYDLTKLVALPEPIHRRLDTIVNLRLEDSGSHCCAILLICYYIDTLYQLDRHWVEEKLYPFYRWQGDHCSPYPRYAWSAWIWQCSINPTIIATLKADLFTIVSDQAKRHYFEPTELHHLDVLFYQVCLAIPELYDRDKIATVLKKHQTLRGHIAWAVAYISSKENHEEQDIFWHEKLQAIVLGAWPREKKYAMTSQEIEYWLTYCFKLKEQFNEAINKLFHYFPDPLDKQKGNPFFALLLTFATAKHLQQQPYCQAFYKVIDYLWPDDNNKDWCKFHYFEQNQPAYVIIRTVLLNTGHLDDNKYRYFKHFMEKVDSPVPQPSI